MNPLWMVAADLRKHLLSSIGTLMLLAAAFSINVAAGIFERGLTDSASRAAAETDLVIGAPGSRLDLVLATVFLRTDETLPLLDYDVAERIASDPRVAASSPFILADHYLNSPIVGVGDGFPDLRPSFHPARGGWPKEDFQAIVGAEVDLTVGEGFRSNHGAVAGSDGEHDHDREYRVVGVLAATGTPWDRAIIVPFRSIWEIHGHDGEPGIAAFLVKPVDFAAAYSLRADYRSEKTTSAFPGEVLSSAFALFSDARGAVSVLAMFLQALVLASVILSLLSSLPSKYRWIGLLRSLGASRLYIFLTLWVQTAVIFLVAACAGLFAGRAGAEILSSAIGSESGLRIHLSWRLEDIYPLALFLLVSFFGALIPAFVGFRVSARRALLAP